MTTTDRIERAATCLLTGQQDLTEETINQAVDASAEFIENHLGYEQPDLQPIKDRLINRLLKLRPINPAVWDRLRTASWTWVNSRRPSDPVTIHSVHRLDGQERFAVRQGPCCLSVDGLWEVEPSPENRDEAFGDRCRFLTLERALVTLEQYGENLSLEEKQKGGASSNT